MAQIFFNVNELKSTMAAIVVGRNVVKKLKTQEDIDNWAIWDNHVEDRSRIMAVTGSFAPQFRDIGHGLFSKKQMPNLEAIFKAVQATDRDSAITRYHLNHGKRVWGRTTLYNFMKRSGFT